MLFALRYLVVVNMKFTCHRDVHQIRFKRQVAWPVKATSPDRPLKPQPETILTDDDVAGVFH